MKIPNKKKRIKVLKPESVLGLIAGVIFLIIGVIEMVKSFSSLVLIWTAFALWF